MLQRKLVVGIRKFRPPHPSRNSELACPRLFPCPAARAEEQASRITLAQPPFAPTAVDRIPLWVGDPRHVVDGSNGMALSPVSAEDGIVDRPIPFPQPLAQ